MTLDASNTLIYDVYSTGITYDDCQYVYSTGHRPYPQMLHQAGKASVTNMIAYLSHKMLVKLTPGVNFTNIL